MNQHTKRRGILAGVGALITAAALALGGSAAIAAPTIPPTMTTANLHITKLTTPDGAPVAANGARVAALPAGAEPIAGVTFSVQRVDNIDLSTNAGWQAAAGLTLNGSTVTGTGSDGNPVTLGAAVTGVTDATGVPQSGGAPAFQNLPIGVYLVQETATPAGVTGSAPFLVTLPMTDPADQSNWMRDVYVYPKNSRIDAPVKSVDDAQQTRVGQNITWTIDAQAPRISGPAGGPTWLAPTAYRIADQLDPRLALQPGTTVQILTAAGAPIGAPNQLVAGDYTVTPAAPAAGGANVVIEFTPAGLAKLGNIAGAQHTVRVVLTTQVVNLPAGDIGDGNIVNSATVFVNDDTTGVTTPTPAISKWGDAEFTKVGNGDRSPLANAEFGVYLTRADARAGAGGAIAHDTSDASGAVEFPGLRLSDWANGAAVQPGDPGYRVYWLAETRAPNGHELLAEPIAFVLTESGMQTIQVDASGNPVLDGSGAPTLAPLTQVVNVEKNAGFALPLTGGTGTMILTIGGIALLATVLLVARRRRAGEATAE